MNTLKFKLFVVVFAFFMLPDITMAYFTTNQTATQLTNDTILYTITYKFGFSGRELYMPIGAIRDNNSTSSSPYLEYTILDDDTPVEIGTSAGLVFSSDKDVQIKDNQYYLAPNRAAEFTLVTFLKIPEEKQNKGLDLSLLVTRLPFTMVKDGKVIPAYLNPSELQYYRTPKIDFK